MTWPSALSGHGVLAHFEPDDLSQRRKGRQEKLPPERLARADGVTGMLLTIMPEQRQTRGGFRVWWRAAAGGLANVSLMEESVIRGLREHSFGLESDLQSRTGRFREPLKSPRGGL